MKVISDDLVQLDHTDFDNMLRGTNLEGMGQHVGVDGTAEVHLDQDGHFMYVDFGECGYCGGRLIAYSPHALFGACNNCGAI